MPEREVIGLYDFFLSDNPDEYAHSGLKQTNDYTTDSLWDLTNTQRLIRHQTTGEYTETILRSKKYSETKKVYLVSDDRILLKNGLHEIMWHYRTSDARDKVATNIHVNNFRGKNYVFPTKEALIDFFFIEMQNIFQQNVYFLDRGTESEESLVKLKQLGLSLKIIDIVHAEHLVTYQNGHPLWNNYYQYMFNHLDTIDFVVTSTKLQAEAIIKQLSQLGRVVADKVLAIPVGGVNNLQQPKHWQGGQANFVTASRLHSEKNILQIIQAIKQICEDGLDATLAIYGSGNEESRIRELIDTLALQDRVQLKGLSQNVVHEFQKYDAFVSASYSEGFGLTYIEAIENSLPIATYANLYGAKELVIDGFNGYLASFDGNLLQESQNVIHLANAMKQIFTDKHYDYLSKGAYQQAQKYQSAYIADQWAKLIEVLE
ncbi:hypothetical protein GCM10025879_13060 [Leuconostoc litchii]|nr:hypothetical protein GCM10025879_13060 [Leuconostoc litchii]